MVTVPSRGENEPGFKNSGPQAKQPEDRRPASRLAHAKIACKTFGWTPRRHIVGFWLIADFIGHKQALKRTIPREERAILVVRGDPLNVVDHQRLDLRLPLLKFQAERFANGCE